MTNAKKICLVSSRGGHLYQLCLFKNIWKNYDRFWITGKGSDVDYLLRNEQIYRGYFPESRNIVNAIKNFFLGFYILFREKPTIVISCGAGIAPPIFLAAKLLGIRCLFIDSISFAKYPSLSAKITRFFNAATLVQHKKIVSKLPGSFYWGSLL